MRYDRDKQQRAGGHRGFTLVEMIVATGIFAIASTMIVGSFLSIQYASKKTRLIRVSSDNLSAALDQMSRTIRTGTTIRCGCAANNAQNEVAQGCARTDELGNGGSANLCLEKQGGARGNVGDQVMFRRHPTQPRIEYSDNNGSTFYPLTADNIAVNSLRFQVGGTEKGKQPAVTILIDATIGVGTRQVTDVRLQTSVAQRTPNQ